MAGLWTIDGFHCQITNDAAREIKGLLKKGITTWGPFKIKAVKTDHTQAKELIQKPLLQKKNRMVPTIPGDRKL